MLCCVLSFACVVLQLHCSVIAFHFRYTSDLSWQFGALPEDDGEKPYSQQVVF